MQTKSENYEICQDVMVSYLEVVVNSWEGLVQFITCVAYKPKDLRRSLWELRRTQLDFEVTMAVELELDFETFSIGNGQPRL